MRAVVLNLLVILATLAGCVEGKVPASVGPTIGATAAAAETSAKAGPEGSIEGVVVDDEEAPVPGVAVAVVEVGLTVETDAAGAFAFTRLEFGSYSVIAEKLGYESTARRVDVQDEEPMTVRLTLKPIAISLARTQSFIADGFFEVAVAVVATSTIVNATGASYRDAYWDVPGDVVSAVMGMTWQTASVGNAKRLWLEAWVARNGCAAGSLCESLNHTEGVSPLVVRSDEYADHADGKKVQVNAYFGLDPCLSTGAPTDTSACTSHPDAIVQVALQQRVKVYATVFFVEPAPEGFNPLPPA